ncbi:MAG TPA: SUF system Fe-S cluster assembly regulator [Polyangiaceae bacterium]
MLRITRLTDYAIVLLGAAARSAPAALTARGAAEQTRLPLPAVKKILKVLVRERLLESQRGTTGGYRLSRPATQIALADVIAAIEGPFALTDCGQSKKSGTRLCEYVEQCGVQSNWARVTGIVRRALASVTLADMIGPGHRELVPLRLRRGVGEQQQQERRGERARVVRTPCTQPPTLIPPPSNPSMH